MAHGIPQDMALKLRNKFNLRYFVETGTLAGATAIWASPHFDRVITIELDPEQRKRAMVNAAARCWRDNIEFILGDSRDKLLPALAGLDAPALIWLDAHWGPDLGYKRPEAGECPILAELAQIKNCKFRHVVLIDDARLFTGNARERHNPSHWPTLEAIRAELAGSPYVISHLKALDCFLCQPVNVSALIEAAAGEVLSNE